MAKFKHMNSSTFSVRWLKKSWPIFIVVVLVVLQVERFIHKGTVLGYQVRSTKSQQVISSQNRSGSILGGTVAKENQKSIACDKFPAEKVSQILKSEVERISGFVPDRTEPLVFSSCIYRTKGDAKNVRSISILYREQKDEVAAKKTLVALKQAKQGEDIKNLGNEAYFNTSANQLTTRSGKKLFTVTVPNITTASKNSKDTAIEITKLGL